MNALFAKLHLAAAACLVLWACNSNTTSGQCDSNLDCGFAQFCNTTADGSGICGCQTDEACETGWYCNQDFACQERLRCDETADCKNDQYCDRTTLQCQTLGFCNIDSQCSVGTVCDHRESQCAEGCRVTADCPLGAVCDGGEANATGALGSCRFDRCTDKSFCAFGEQCVDQECVPATAEPYCGSCASTLDCDADGALCLSEDTGTRYCGPACAESTDCPNGYSCARIVLGQSCTEAANCGANRDCVFGEGQAVGVCSCLENNDCSVETLPPKCQKQCSQSGADCRTSSDCNPGESCRPAVCTWPPGQACQGDDTCDPIPLCTDIGPGGSLVCTTDGTTACTTANDCLCLDGICLSTGKPCSGPEACLPTCIEGTCLLGQACTPAQGLVCDDVR